MRYNRQPGFLIFVLAAVLAFSSSAANGTQGRVVTEREILTVPIAVYILASTRANSNWSSKRTVESMDAHFDQVNRIWSQADIVIEPVVVRQIKASDYLIKGLSRRVGRGGIADFFRAIYNGKIKIGNPYYRQGMMMAFYVPSLGGPNGLMPLGVNALFVADNTTVSDARVTSHEIGHNLGLYHAPRNPGQLLFSGTNGVELTETEQIVARYNARKFL